MAIHFVSLSSQWVHPSNSDSVERSAVNIRLLCCVCVCQVMVWIHGGGLTMGAASQFDGSSLAAYENIIMVIIQYRLGILGFLR